MRVTFSASVMCAALISASCGTTSPSSADIGLVEPDITSGALVAAGDRDGPFIHSAPPVCLADASDGPVTITQVVPTARGIEVTDFSVVPAGEHDSASRSMELAAPGATLRSLGYPAGKTVQTPCAEPPSSAGRVPKGDVLTIETRRVFDHTETSTHLTLEYRNENGETASWNLPFELTLCAPDDERDECDPAVHTD